MDRGIKTPKKPSWALNPEPLFSNDINAFKKKNHLSNPSEHMQLLEQTCNSLTRAFRGNMAGMGTSRRSMWK